MNTASESREHTNPLNFIGAWVLLIFLGICMLIGAYTIGRAVVGLSDASLPPTTSEAIADAGAHAMYIQAHAWARGLPGVERIPSVQYVSEYESILRIEQLVEGKPTVCTVYLDARAKRSSVAC